MKFLLIMLIVVLKTILTKVFILGLLILFFYIKSINLKKSKENFDSYFNNLTKKKIDIFIMTIYILASILSLEIVYILFNIFNIIKPLLLTIIIGVISFSISYIRYKKYGTEKVEQFLNKIKNK